MKKLSWLRYLSLIVLIIGLLMLDKFISFKISSIVAYNMEALKYYNLEFLISTLICLVIGALLGLEYFVAETKKGGRWRFNWLRASILLIPSLLLILPPYVYFRYLYSMCFFLGWKNSLDYLPILRVLFAYWVITSFYKQGKIKVSISDEQGDDNVTLNAE